MKNLKISAKAQVIDEKAKTKKILYASLALLLGLLAVVIYSSKTHAQSMSPLTFGLNPSGPLNLLH
jgi:hypothetical protein